MLAIGTKVYHDGHGAGTIVAYNGRAAVSYAAANFGSELVGAAVQAGLTAAIVDSMYGCDRYPYVVQFEPTERYPAGYKDVYDVDGAVMKVV